MMIAVLLGVVVIAIPLCAIAWQLSRIADALEDARPK